MAQAVVAEDVTPLKEETDNLVKGSDSESVPVSPATDRNSGLFSFLYQRSTYYWIAFIAQFCQVTLQVIGAAVATTHKKYDEQHDIRYTAAVFLASDIYSLFCLLCNVALLILHYTKGSDVSRKRFTAGKHFILARSCAIMNFFTLSVFLVGPALKHGEQTYPDEIRPIIFPLLIGFVVVATFAYAAAAYITYKSAVHSRGTDMVIDPHYRVQAWTLSTTEEVQALSKGNRSS